MYFIPALFFRGIRGISTAGRSLEACTPTYTSLGGTPRDLVIPAGSKVIWINKDEEPHKIAEVNSNFGSQPLDTDGSFTYEFKSAGKFEYFCTLHPRMTGHILVGGK